MNPYILRDTKNNVVGEYDSIGDLLSYTKMMMPSGLYYVDYISTPLFTIMAEYSHKWENTLHLIFYDNDGNEIDKRYTNQP